VRLALLLLALAACSETAPTPLAGSGMQMDIGQLPDDWVPAAKVAVGSWRDALDKLHAKIVAVTPVRGANGGTVPYLMQLHATDAAGKVVYDTTALVSGREVINHLPAKTTPYLASIGFSRRSIDPDLLATILVVTSAIPEQWRGATAELANDLLVLTRDRERLEVRFTEHGAFTVTPR
jgi:hypothetical protein